jgi:hypothetical protein
MEPTPDRRPLSAADVQRLAEQMQRPQLGKFQPVGRRPVFPPPPAGAIDGAPEFPEASLQQVQQQLAGDVNAWFTDLLLQGLLQAGEPATLATLPDYAGRLSMRRYADGLLVVVLDAEPKIADHPGKMGTALFGVGEPVVSVGEGLRITRPILTAWEARAYEYAERLKARPLDLEQRRA